ncbi:MAG: hypothetical protein J5379_00125 [Clostridiales bacterium]|nr:hypothetical protein [Clostridiales bacterium]
MDQRRVNTNARTQLAIHGEGEMIQKNEFARFIREKRRDYNDLHHEQLTTRKIAQHLSLNQSSFPKVLNRERPTKKRDLIIAIGIVLGLFPGEVSEALRLYEMPELEDQRKLSGEEVDRDRFISKMLINNSSSQENGCSIEQFNQALMDNGFAPLSITSDHLHRHKEG